MRCFILSRRAMVGLALLLPLARQAEAVTISASSSGYGLFVDVDALALSLNVGPLPVGASGTAPAPYNLSDSVVDLNVTSSIPLVVSGLVGADVVNGTATSNVDGLPGSRTTNATGGVVGAEIDATTLPILGNGLNLIGVDGTLSSMAQITGDFGALVATGTTTIESLSLTIAGISVNLAAYVGVNVAPNTSVNLAVLGIANASLILNEQSISPDNSSITVNAFHLSVNLLNIGGEVILGHSQVIVSAVVPEPATGALFVLGLIPLLCTRRVCWSARARNSAVA